VGKRGEGMGGRKGIRGSERSRVDQEPTESLTKAPQVVQDIL
jgi:hypothetical protein